MESCPSETQSLKPYPSTPSVRLPLDEVDCNTSYKQINVVSNRTPEEFIGWNTTLSPKAADVSALTGLKRSRRYRSSSPLNSSQNEPSCNIAKSTANDQGPQKLTVTPKADPAADLWTKYTTNKVAGDAETKPQIWNSTHLIGKSSPWLDGENCNRKGGGLRRWASCGVEWPTSKSKRRKTRAFVCKDKDDNSRETYIQANAEMGNNEETSKLGVLIERMQETLAQTIEKETTPIPSSSSPLPKGKKTNVVDVSSPLRPRGIGEGLVDIVDANINNGIGDRKRAYATKLPGTKEVLGFETASNSKQESNIVRKCDVISGSRLSATKDKKSPPDVTAHAPSNISKGRSESDEFGEEDLITGELESFASLYDSRSDVYQHESSKHQTKPNQANKCKKPLSNKSYSKNQTNISFPIYSEDDYGGDDIDAEQCAVVEAIATQGLRDSNESQVTSERKSRLINRYRVKEALNGQYEVNGRKWPERVLILEEEHTRIRRTASLRQSWYNTACEPGDYVHASGRSTTLGQHVIDDSDGVLILHPDHLISVTSVADSYGCTRRAVLQDRIKATSSVNMPQVTGHILHELFQRALTENRWDTVWLEATLNSIMPNYYESLIVMDTSVETIVGQLKVRIEQLQSWANLYVSSQPKLDAKVKDRNNENVTMSIKRLLDVEEHIWSPRFGMKGNIDATVESTIVDDRGRRVVKLPLELKSGKATASVCHEAQTTLYTLLMSDRYDIDVVYGMLCYLGNAETVRISAERRHLVQMIIRRNELASYLRARSILPPVLNNSRLCGQCYAQTSCFLYHKLSEDGTGDRLQPKQEFNRLVRNLTQDDQAFFKKWDDLLSKEESEMMKFRRELWTMTSEHRQKLGRCFSNVIIVSGSASGQDGSKIGRFLYTFAKYEGSDKCSFLESQISVGEPIVVSDERGHYALANGFATSIRRDKITVAVDKKLRGIHNSTSEVQDEETLARNNSPTSTGDNILYRVDKDEFSNGMALIRKNLIQIMIDEVFKARTLRSLIVQRMPPIFKSNEYERSDESRCTSDMNSDQRAAVNMVMRAKDYALVLGMPGTGKTTTISHIIKSLVSNKKSILLASYTHTAVDNILLKLQDAGIPILRLGALAKIHPRVQEFALLAAKRKNSLEEVKQSWHDPLVVATTCLGVNHHIFSTRVFDYCIVDEASQITLPVCLGPIRMAKTFILVGDHFQLPPLVQNKQAMEGGLDVSLFKMLSEAHPSAVVTLEHQYRMCADIMLLANTLIYNGQLKCGDEGISRRKLERVEISALKKFHSSVKNKSTTAIPKYLCKGYDKNCWLEEILSPSARVRFLNTDTLLPESLEGIAGQRIVNQLEATLTLQLLTSLTGIGVPGADIGVITFYRSQLALLKQMARHLKSVEMYTADRFQGRDKEVIIVSCVRSNSRPKTGFITSRSDEEENGQLGDLLRDWRRVNVAITRARSKLIIIGSVNTLKVDKVLRKLIDLCTERGWLHDLPSEATKAHIFPVVENMSQDQHAKSPKSAVKKTYTGPKSSERVSPKDPKSGRAILGETQGKATRMPSSHKGVPQKIGHAKSKGILSTRPVLKDIVNDILHETI